MAVKYASRFPEVRATAKEASAAAATAMAQHVYVMSQEEVPVDTKRLKLSGRVEKAKRVSGGYQARVTYGDKVVDYAVAVHENRYKKRRPARFRTGKAQYLRDPAMKVAELAEAGYEAMEAAFRKLEGTGHRAPRAVRDYGPQG